MNWLTVEGFKPYDGRYQFPDPDEFTTREWGWLKRLTGYLPATIEDGYKGVDPELIACFAVISLRRAGRVDTAAFPDVFEKLRDVPFDGTRVRIESDDADAETDADAGPPPPSSSGSSPTSGDASPTSSGSSTGAPNGSGTPDSATSPWDLPTLAT